MPSNLLGEYYDPAFKSSFNNSFSNEAYDQMSYIKKVGVWFGNFSNEVYGFGYNKFFEAVHLVDRGRNFEQDKKDFIAFLFSRCVKFYNFKGHYGLAQYEEGISDGIKKYYASQFRATPLTGYDSAKRHIREDDYKGKLARFKGDECGSSNYIMVQKCVRYANKLFPEFK